MPRVAVEGLAIGKSQLQRLRHRVKVIGTVMPGRLEGRRIEDVERLAEHRALAPGAAGVDGGSGKAHRWRGFDRRMVVGEILRRQPSALLLVEGHDRLGDIAAIERGTGGLESDRAVAMAGEAG